MAVQDYLSLVRSQDLESLEVAWAQAVADPGDVDRYCVTLRELGLRGETGTAVELGSQMLEALDAKDRTADAVQLGTTLLVSQVHNDSLSRKVFGLVQKAFASEAWFEIALEVSGLGEANLSSDAFASFDVARRMTPGHVVYHRAGWGEGVVEELDIESRQIQIRFKSGSTKDIPIQSAVESMRPLDADDLRTMRMVKLEELQRVAEETPGVVIRMAAKAYRGKINSTQLKTEMTDAVIPAKKWNSWWKKAKVAASNDPWLLVEGSTARPVFELRKVPVSLADEAARAMGHALDLPAVIEVCRDYLGRGLDADATNTVLALAQERVEKELGAHAETPAHLLDGILFLEEHGRKTSVSAAQELKELLTDADGNFAPRQFDELHTQKSREHAVRLLPEAFGDAWADTCVQAITDFPKTVAEQVVDLLEEKECADHLCAAWSTVAPYPRKHPILTFRIGKLYADGAFDEREDKPDLLAVNRVLLHLCRVISMEPKSNTALHRVKTKAQAVLLGRRGTLPACLEEVSRDDLASLLGIAERGGSEFPQEITDAILKVVARRFPDITSKPEKPFWERDDFIYVTAEGLRRKREEHRVLVDEKIPANATTIGNAAALGDLSENSEWEAAMEEQRNLTGRAEEMSREIRMARLIEDQELPTEVASPGMKVQFTFLDDNSAQTYRILGPWDAVEDDILNYRAPLAKALLGHRAGDEVEIESPSGSRPARIDALERIV